jgi:hypothetical protein
MKHLKMIGLAAVLAMALAAVAASSASAAVLCKAAPNKSGVCEGGKYASGTHFTATSEHAVLTVTGSFLANTVTCTHSVVALKNTAESGSPGVPGEVTDVEFSGCSLNGGATTCTVTTTSGYTGSLTPSDDKGNGNLHMTGTAETTVKCGEFHCKYTVPSSGMSLNFTGGDPFVVHASEEQLTIESFGFGCGTGAKWDAKYTGVGTNKAVWVATS